MSEFGTALRAEWMIDPTVTYLNHGTVGAPPRRVLAAQQAIRDEIELQPATFLLRELADPEANGSWVGEPPRLRRAAATVAAFVGADSDDLAFVDNATTGANAVLRSFPFAPGDEILVTDLGYGGVLRAVDYAALRAQATVRTASMPRPGAAPEAFVDAIESAIGPRTRMLVVDHITAATALVLPLAEIAAACHRQGVTVLADGAHGPGAIDIDIPALGVDWYAGNLHKWAWTPRSSGILWVAPEQQARLHAPVISWGYGNGLAAEFDLLGTRDPSAHLAAPAALAMLAEFGVDRVRAYNHELAWAGAQLLTDRWGTAFDTPESMIGTMAAVALPAESGSTTDDAKRLQASLLAEDRIEIPLAAEGGRMTARLSAQVYVDLDDVGRLADAVLRRL